MRNFTKYFMTLWLCGATQLTIAENATEVAGYTIHHNAITTDSLTPGVARAYNIQRSNSRGLITISVLKNQPNATGIPVKAEITVNATNLNGQLRSIKVREINEGGAIYYIGDFHISNEETLNFELEVTPVGDTKTYKANLTQDFFVE